MRDALLLCGTALFSILALRQPAVGMLAYVGYSFLGPHSMTWSVARAFPHVQLIAICTIVSYVCASEPKRWPREREAVILLALWSTFCVSSLLALAVDRALDELWHISKLLLMVFLAMSLLNSERRLKL